MFPVLLIAIGIAVLALGQRLAVLGAAVGALLGVGLLRLFPGAGNPLLQLALVGGLAVGGFILAGFAKGIVDLVILALGALGGAAIVLGFLDLFNIDRGLLDWLLAVVGAVVGLVLIRRFRRGTKDWELIILSALVGALLVTRGLTIWFPVLHGVLGSLLVIALAGGRIAYAGGWLGRRAPAAHAPAAGEVASATETAAPPPPAPE